MVLSDQTPQGQGLQISSLYDPSAPQGLGAKVLWGRWVIEDGGERVGERPWPPSTVLSLIHQTNKCITKPPQPLVSGPIKWRPSWDIPHGRVGSHLGRAPHT